MANTLTLTKDYGYTQFRYSGTADAIDATDATWIVANQGSKTNNYPFLVDDAKTGIDIFGATINGEVSLTGEWAKLYSNSAAFMVRDTKEVDVYDLRITQSWDAIRIAHDSDGFEVSNVWATHIRDDAFENDHGSSGTISNSLFDGAFSGLSMTHQLMPNLKSKVVTLDNVLMRMQSYSFRGDETHQSPFKIEANSPSLAIHNTVLAIDDVNHIGQGRLEQAWDKTVSASNNYFLNLSDDPLPKNYPLPGEGWTVLQGQAARDYWEAARDEWIANYGATAGETVTQSAPEEAAATDETATDPAPVETPAVEAPVVVETPAENLDTSDIAASAPVSDTANGKIVLDSTILDALQPGADGEARTLEESEFTIAGRAGDAEDRIMYKFKTGEVFYDADGTGPIKQIKIAQLEDRQYFDHTDFLVSGTAESGPEVAKIPAGQETTTITPAENAPVVEISGFETGVDQIVLDSSVLQALSDQKGAELDDSSFTIAGRAGDAEDRIMYKFKTGELYYDADGTGSEAQIKIGELDAHMYLDHSDFLVV